LEGLENMDEKQATFMREMHQRVIQRMKKLLKKSSDESYKEKFIFKLPKKNANFTTYLKFRQT
jgi:hypothetical protein